MNMENPDPIEGDDGEFDLKAYLPEKWYNLLKGLAAPILPAAATFVLALGMSEKAAVVMTALSAFLGVLTKASANRYKKATNVGDVVVSTTPEGKTLYSLEVGVPVEKIKNLDTMTFGVKQDVAQE